MKWFFVIAKYVELYFLSVIIQNVDIGPRIDHFAPTYGAVTQSQV